MKKNIFNPTLQSNCRKLLELYRLKFSLVVAIVKYLLKAVTGGKVTEHEKQIYYYYLTLIHCKFFHKRFLSPKMYFSGGNLKFVARLGQGCSDLENLNQVFGREEYLLLVKLFNEHFNEKAACIIDAGANVGYATLFLNSHFPQAKFICIEPDKDNFLLLQENCLINQLNNCKLVNEGLWNKDTDLALSSASANRGSWGFSYVESAVATGVKAVDFKRLIKSNEFKEIDILKIDIEGAESILFNRDDYMKSILSVTKVIGIEIHDDMSERAMIMGQLELAGFALQDVGDMTFGYNVLLK